MVGDPPRLVVDTKYARAERLNEWGGLSYKNEHAYQIVFYGLAHACPGILIYPRDDRDIDATYEIDGQRFTFMTVDLQRESLGGLSVLAAAVRRWASELGRVSVAASA